MLFNEPKLLKYKMRLLGNAVCPRFSALQRAEIAEIVFVDSSYTRGESFSALQRAEIAEIHTSARCDRE